MILGIVGRSIDPYGNTCSIGTGKDKATDVLVEKYRFTKIALADEIKRICVKVYGFSENQLWGPSEERNKPDKRYPRKHSFDLSGKCKCCGCQKSMAMNQQCYLTPRYAIQQLGTDWGRDCYTDTWVNFTMNIAKQLIEGYPEKAAYVQPIFYDGPDEYYMQQVYPSYSQVKGLSKGRNIAEHYRVKNVVFSDVRFINEINCIRSNGGKILLIVRSVKKLPDTVNLEHISENDLRNYSVDDSNSPWDYVVENNGTLEQLSEKVAKSIGI